MVLKRAVKGVQPSTEFRVRMRTTLDGVTLLRYSHIYRDRTSGGAEQYLKQINEGLLARNRMTIFQMHLVGDDSDRLNHEVEVEQCGQGRIVWVPIRFYHEERSVFSLPRRLRRLAVPPTSATSLVRSVMGNSCGNLRYSFMILSDVLVKVLAENRVDLVILHWLSYDVGTLIANAVRRHIPYAIVHHFDNERLLEQRTQNWVKGAAAIGGVSNLNVPHELQGSLVNLSDAVDVDFFTSIHAKPVARPDGVVVLLPSRVVEGKGHADLLLAAKNLMEAGKNVSLVFAGAVQSETVRAELDQMVCRLNMRERVLFLGELKPVDLRDWYAASDIVVLPSSSEGLGRVLLEAQAMGKPVIAYESGGMPEALIPDKTGFLVETGNHDALADRIDHLLSVPTERLAMGRSGREFVLDRFSVRTLIERHERFIAGAISG